MSLQAGEKAQLIAQTQAAVIAAEILAGTNALGRQASHAVQTLRLAALAGKVERVQPIGPGLVLVQEELPQVRREGVEQRQRQITPLVDKQHEVIDEAQALKPGRQRLQLGLAWNTRQYVGNVSGPFGELSVHCQSPQGSGTCSRQPPENGEAIDDPSNFPKSLMGRKYRGLIGILARRFWPWQESRQTRTTTAAF
ncbi:hypothetical protein D9M70_439260 [compost metagenome]